MANIIDSDALITPIMPINYSSPNYQNGTVSEQLNPNQQPLGTQFKSYELNQASNYWTLDPFQYNITKFDYNFPDKRQSKKENFTEGLVYKDVNFEKLLSNYTSVKKSVNDFPAQSYHRFEANDGYFNPQESVNNSDLWYYGSDRVALENGLGVGGAPLNVQEVNHIIFPESQRGGTDSRNLTKYSWSNTIAKDTTSWEHKNDFSINNNQNCQFFNYNNGYNIDINNQPFDRVYKFDSGYCRSIGINSPYTGSMPFNPNKIA